MEELIHAKDDPNDRVPRITLAFLKKLLFTDDKNYYMDPTLNEVIYLQYRGFSKIENLHIFTNLTCLYLQSNMITKIEGLKTLVKLRSIFLSDNLIEKIEGLDTLVNLTSLDLSTNRIQRIEGLSKLTLLDTLNLNTNSLGKNGLNDVIEVLDATELTTLDLSDNSISSPEILEEVFCRMQKIAWIKLTNNPAVKKIESYRKQMIAKLAKLKYLDDMPVFAEDRRYAEAFWKGGLEEEKNEMRKIKKETDEKDEQNRKAFEDMIKKAREGKVYEKYNRA